VIIIESSPAARYVPSADSDTFGQLAFKRIQERAVEAYTDGQREAAVLELAGREADAYVVDAVLAAVGRAYAAAAVNQVAEAVITEVEEETYMAICDTAAGLDLDVVEDLDGANGDGIDWPIIRVLRRESGWVLPDYTDLADCTSNHHRAQEGREPCTGIAVWRVVEDHGMHLTISWWCDTDLPAVHRPQEGAAA
jgi:hypothetical protein